jgi:hypothetical protein
MIQTWRIHGQLHIHGKCESHMVSLCLALLRVSRKRFLTVRLQVDDGEDGCYDDDYPYDTDDSNGNCTIILLP